MSDDREIALEHAWRYFQYHAEQRISVFNFFVATAGLLVTGLAFTTQASAETWPLGLAAGLLLMLISLAFWRLDGRVSSMIKLAEEVVVLAEAQLITDPALRMISREQILTADTQFGWFRSWTYGRAFRFIFASMALVGLIGSGFSITRALITKNQSTREQNGGKGPKIVNTTARLAPPSSQSPTHQIIRPSPKATAN